MGVAGVDPGGEGAQGVVSVLQVPVQEVGGGGVFGSDGDVVVDGLGAEGVPGVADFDDGWVGEVVFDDWADDIAFEDRDGQGCGGESCKDECGEERTHGGVLFGLISMVRLYCNVLRLLGVARSRWKYCEGVVEIQQGKISKYLNRNGDTLTLVETCNKKKIKKYLRRRAARLLI